MISNLMSKTNWAAICQHFEYRVTITRKLSRLMNAGHDPKKRVQFSDLALGLSDPMGNFSASNPKFKLGAKIVIDSPDYVDSVFNLARGMLSTVRPLDILSVIQRASIKNLGVSVGSEIASMLNPDNWTLNKRTLWAHLLENKKGDLQAVNVELRSFEQGIDSEINYSYWKYYFLPVGTTLLNVADESKKHIKYDFKKHIFLWADAVANQLYEENNKI